MSEPVPESKPASMPEPAEDPWRIAFVEFRTRDEKMVKDYQEEIDTLLVFVRGPRRFPTRELTIFTSQAGLFSAVLTAFVVESYQSLQEDYTQTSVDLLRHISYQLATSSFPAAPDSSQFQAQRSDARVNVCWFVSLLLSLVVALFGIFLKQWMRTYIKWTDITPDREAVALRQFRYRGLETWRLGAILALLPTLLQLSVILFLSGLLLFLWNLDRMVANVMVVLTSIAFFFVATVTVLPAVSSSCPYWSPLSEITAVTFSRMSFYGKILRITVAVFVNSGWTYSWNSWKYFAHLRRVHSKSMWWLRADNEAIAQYDSNKDHVSMHVQAVVHLCCTTQSQLLWSAATSVVMAESPTNGSVSDHRIIQTYCNEVWWPVLGHVSLFTPSDLEFALAARSSNLSLLSRSASSAFRRLSSSMKHCWISFLLDSKALVCQSDSTLMVVSYMICCLVGLDSTTGGPCMGAFMDVLEAQYANLQERELAGIASLLARRDCDIAFDVLLDSLAGLSSRVIIVP
jgi:hypothetical protein